MPRGANAKREREYAELKGKFQKSGRYGNRAAEVASRIVNKQRAQYGETKAGKRKDAEGPSRTATTRRSPSSPVSRLRGLAAPKAYDRPMNAALFEEWVENCLVPLFRQGISSSGTICLPTWERGSKNSSITPRPKL